MGVINLPARLKACNRQKLLWELHCKEICDTRLSFTNEPCEGCPIFEQLLELGEVFNETVRERKEVSSY